MKTQPMHSCRSGVSLVELVIVISVFGVMLSSILTLMHKLLQAETRLRAAAATDGVVLRASRLFRDDVLTAEKVLTTDIADESKTKLLLVDGDGKQIQWQADGKRLHRIVTNGGREVHRDHYTMRGPSAFAVSLDKPSKVTLRIYRDGMTKLPAGHPAVPRKLQLVVTATLGRRNGNDRMKTESQPARAETSQRD